MATDERSFGYLLRRYRLAALLTQEQLAERAHLSHRTISDLERGAKHSPRRDTVLLLADALELSSRERATLIAAAHPVEDATPARACPRCGTGVLFDQEFCGKCGSPLQQGVSPPDGPALRPAAPLPIVVPPSTASSPPAPAVPVSEERRLVTALFCDLVGFTALSRSLDPEEVREIQAAYFSAMSAQIDRYDGTVEKYAGDAVLALFGVPAAHEDDAERAVLCAIAMRDAIRPIAQSVQAQHGRALALRIGVDSGEVVSGRWDASGRQDVAVTGSALNAAAHIEAAAEPGEILVGRETVRLSRRRIRYGEERLLRLKGESDPVPVYPARGIVEAAGGTWQTRPLDGVRQLTPLVGRARELEHLQELWERVTGGEGQLLTVIGEPGVGKSRLLVEGIGLVKLQTADVRILQGRCLSYGQSVSLWLIADLLRGLIGVGEADGPDEVRAAVTVTLTDLLEGGDVEDQREAIDVLGEVLGLPAGGSMVAQAGPQIRRAALIRSLRRVLGSLSERVPVVLMLEDLHWIDEASQEVFSEVVVDVPGLRLLVLASQRPGWNAPWGEWSWTERISLRPLGESDAALLAGAVLGEESEGKVPAGASPSTRLAPDLRAYLQDRAGGNPFFVEELIRALQEAGGLEEQDGEITLRAGAAEKLPATLTEVILARLDRLEAEVKGVAQVGSVIGRSFAVRLLARVMEQNQAALELPLTGLQQAELAFPRRSTELEYVFKHATVQEVAYGMLVQKRRKQLHLAAARAIAQLYPSDEYVEMIAYHYARADAPEAAEWLEKAGDRAASIYANEVAISHYQGARGRLQRPGCDRLQLAHLDEKLGGVLATTGRYAEAIPIIERAIEGYRAAADLERAASATALLGRVHRERGTPEEGIARVQSMIELVSDSGPSSALAAAYVTLMSLYFLTGRYRDVVEAAERGAGIARAVGNERLIGEAEMRRGSALTQLGRPEEGRLVQESALPIVETGGDLVTLWINLNNLGHSSFQLGHMEQARRYLERALAVNERIGNPGYLCFALGSLGELLSITGDWDEAFIYLERGAALARSLGAVPSAAVPLHFLGALGLWQGNWESASRHLNEALAVSKAGGDRQVRELCEASLAELDAREGRAEAAIHRLEGLVDEERAELGAILPPLIRAYLALGGEEHLQQAAAMAIRALTWASEQPRFRVDALWIRGMVLGRQSQLDEAESCLAQGLELTRSMPFPYAEARILCELGLLQKQREKVKEARQRLEEALAIFRRLGAKKDIEQAEEMLAGTWPAWCSAPSGPVQ
ncbi:MAG TPA: tetratricopeptide repeat protein [Chloroflexota bacterium]|nr:tetratricopeptide repeat protein [Chloroflexota bacterium]